MYSRFLCVRQELRASVCILNCRIEILIIQNRIQLSILLLLHSNLSFSLPSFYYLWLFTISSSLVFPIAFPSSPIHLIVYIFSPRKAKLPELWDGFKCAQCLSLFLFFVFSSRSLSLLCCRSRKTAVTLYSVVPFPAAVPAGAAFITLQIPKDTFCLPLSNSLFHTYPHTLYSGTWTSKREGQCKICWRILTFLWWFRCCFSRYVNHASLMVTCNV